MGMDVSVILSVYGAVFDGALPLAWSIGGGVRTGIGGSHGHYETDNSPFRGDLHQYGSNTDLVMGQFKQVKISEILDGGVCVWLTQGFVQFFDLQPDPATANYNIDVLSKFRGMRFNDSIAKNPYFYCEFTISPT